MSSLDCWLLLLVPDLGRDCCSGSRGVLGVDTWRADLVVASPSLSLLGSPSDGLLDKDMVHMRSRDGVQDHENSLVSPDPFPLEGGIWE